MAYCTFSYTASGSQTSWSLPFEYIDASSIKVYVNGALAVIDTDYTFDENTNTITFTSTPTSGTVIKIYRESDIVDGYASFTEGSVLTAEDLNATIEQSLQSFQEVSDRLDSVTTDGCLLAVNNLSDLSSVSDARTNLGLGNSSTKNVGNTSGTICAGDDARLSSSLQKSSNLSDLISASSARTNLGLGDSSIKNVGNTSGTVCAGDDARLSSGLQKSSNLSDLTSASTARTNLGLGSASTLSVGTSANNIVQLDSSGKLPAVDGSQLTNISGSGTITGGSNLGTGSGVYKDVSGANLEFKSLVAGTNVTLTDGTDSITISAASSGGGDMYKADNLAGLASKSVARANLDLGSAATLNAGTGANEVLKLDADGKIVSTIGFASPSSTRSALELGSASLLNYGTSALNLIQLDANAKYPSSLDFSSPSTTRSKLELGSASLLNASATGANDVLKLDASGKIPSTIEFASTSSARAALGLGDSATKSVGTASGTVCAGDDSRLDGNVKTANNLSDVTASTARTNLGLGTAATLNVGTSANNVVQLNGSGYLPALNGSLLTNISASSSFVLNVQSFSSSGTYTPTANMKYCIVDVVGGGGGGGGTSTTNTACGSGGAGAYAQVLLTAAQTGSSVSVTVGTAGAGGAPGSIGSYGATSSFGSIISCPGGSGGSAGAPGGNSGGTGGSLPTISAGTVLYQSIGQSGGYSFAQSGMVFTTCGGNSQLGQGGTMLCAAGAAYSGVQGFGYGSGGSGAIAGTSGGSVSGGAGTPGRVIVTEYCST